MPCATITATLRVSEVAARAIPGDAPAAVASGTAPDAAVAMTSRALLPSRWAPLVGMERGGSWVIGFLRISKSRRWGTPGAPAPHRTPRPGLARLRVSVAHA